MTQAAVYKKIVALEREVQKMKIEAYRAFPKAQRSRPISAYSEKALFAAVRTARNKIWKRDYAKKTKGLS